MGHDILLLDEPTAGLDPMGEYRMMHLLQKLNRENGVTIVMATQQRRSRSALPAYALHIEQGCNCEGGHAGGCIHRTRRDGEREVRLPHIAELIHSLKHKDKLPFDKLPLTIGEARREILKVASKSKD